MSSLTQSSGLSHSTHAHSADADVARVRRQRRVRRMRANVVMGVFSCNLSRHYFTSVSSAQKATVVLFSLKSTPGNNADANEGRERRGRWPAQIAVPFPKDTIGPVPAGHLPKQAETVA
jgi:hypothetical protein